jgi:hypothetical protein
MVEEMVRVAGRADWLGVGDVCKSAIWVWVEEDPVRRKMDCKGIELDLLSLCSSSSPSPFPRELLLPPSVEVKVFLLAPIPIFLLRCPNGPPTSPSLPLGTSTFFLSSSLSLWNRRW